MTAVERHLLDRDVLNRDVLNRDVLARGDGGRRLLARYDELAALGGDTSARPPADPALTAEVTALVHREARWLDDQQFDPWLDWFTTDAVVWVPLPGVEHPATDQSLFLDDRRRLGERIAWRRQSSAWGQQPASTCVRVVGTVEAWPDRDATVVRSALTLVEHRHGVVQMLAGHQFHELRDDGGELRCRTKVIRLPALGTGVRNPSFVL